MYRSTIPRPKGLPTWVVGLIVLGVLLMIVSIVLNGGVYHDNRGVPLDPVARDSSGHVDPRDVARWYGMPGRPTGQFVERVTPKSHTTPGGQQRVAELAKFARCDPKWTPIATYETDTTDITACYFQTQFGMTIARRDGTAPFFVGAALQGHYLVTAHRGPTDPVFVLDGTTFRSYEVGLQKMLGIEAVRRTGGVAAEGPVDVDLAMQYLLDAAHGIRQQADVIAGYVPEDVFRNCVSASEVHLSTLTTLQAQRKQLLDALRALVLEPGSGAVPADDLIAALELDDQADGQLAQWITAHTEGAAHAPCGTPVFDGDPNWDARQSLIAQSTALKAKVVAENNPQGEAGKLRSNWTADQL